MTHLESDVACTIDGIGRRLLHIADDDMPHVFSGIHPSVGQGSPCCVHRKVIGAYRFEAPFMVPKAVRRAARTTTSRASLGMEGSRWLAEVSGRPARPERGESSRPYIGAALCDVERHVREHYFVSLFYTRPRENPLAFDPPFRDERLTRPDRSSETG